MAKSSPSTCPTVIIVSHAGLQQQHLLLRGPSMPLEASTAQRT